MTFTKKLWNSKMGNKSLTGRKNNKNGHFAELLARLFLNLKGYRCLAQNCRGKKGSSAGEIDLIMRKGKTIAFVEVKTRKNLEQAAYAILPKQQQRIIKAAETFLQKNPAYRESEIRFDAVLISLPLIRHIPNAWQA